MLAKIDRDFDKITLVVLEQQTEKTYLGSKSFIVFNSMLNQQRVLVTFISNDNWINFQLEVNYLIIHLNMILKKNYTSSLELEEKKLVFNSLEKYFYFLFQIKDLLKSYKKSITNKNMSEFEGLIYKEKIDNHNFIKGFENYRPKN